jgi:hypothetical protein
MKHAIDIDDALEDDCLGHQIVLDVTYRYSALHGGFEFPDRNTLLIHGQLLQPQG